jgi:hypothetical protein
MKLQDVKKGVRVMDPAYGLFYVMHDEVEVAVHERVKYFNVMLRPVGANYTFPATVSEKEMASWDLHEYVDRDHV